MKKLAILFAFLFASIAGFSQNGVYLFGFLENGPGTPVNIHFQVNTVPSVDTILVADANGSTSTIWLDLPNMNWTSIQATFIDCFGNQVTVVNNYSPNDLPIDAYIVLNYCADDPLVYGCTDPYSISYNPNATIDDGSCEYLNCEVEVYAYTNDDCSIIEITLFADDTLSIGGGYWTINGEEYDGFDSWLTFDAPEPGTYEICFEGWSPYCINGIFGCTYVEVPPDCFEPEDCPAVLVDYYTNECYALIGLDNISPQETVAWYVNGEGPIYNSGYWTYQFQENGVYEFCAMYEQEGCDSEEYCTAVDVWNCGNQQIFGCMDSTAINYNPLANIDNGSCIYGNADNDLCADALPLQIGTFIIDNSNAVINENIWGECWGFGSGEGEQTSIWFSFTTPDEPAAIDIVAISDGTFTLTDTQFGLFTECGGEMIYCDGNSAEGLLSAFHFACDELEENTEYILMVDGWNGDAGTCLLSYNVTTGCDSLIYGCMDPGALNYNPLANVDDGSCQYIEDCEAYIVTSFPNCSTFVFCAYPLNSNELIPGSWFVDGVVFDTWNLVSEYVFDEPGVYEICFETILENCNETIYTCTSVIVEESCFDLGCPEMVIVADSAGCGAWHYIVGGIENDIYDWYFGDNQTATGPSGIYHGYDGEGYYKACIAYEPNDNCQAEEICAYVEISGCGEDVLGCMDPNAINYNPNANVDDGSCTYWEDCWIAIETDQLNCSTFVFTNFVVNDGWPIDGDWYINGNLYQFNGSQITFEATSSGTYDICFEAYIPNCEDYAFSCTTVTVGEDCFETTECPELYAQLDSCVLIMQLLNVDPNQTVEWFVNNEGPLNIAGPWQYVIPADGVYSVCAVYTQEGCNISDFCTDIVAEGCSEDIFGCMDPNAINYNPNANVDDGSCTYWDDCWVEIVVDQVNCSTFVFTNFMEINGWPVDGDWYVDGDLYQSNGTVITFEALATGTYDICFEAYIPNCEDYAFSCLSVTVSEDCFDEVCPEMVIVADSTGCGAWHYIVGGNGNEVYDWYFDNNQTASGPSGIYHEYEGNGTYKACIGFEPTPSCQAGEICAYVEIIGCNEDVFGCMDSTALNYNPEATIDDGSCIYGFECNIGFTINFGTDSSTISIVPDDNILDALEVLWTFGDGSSSNELFPVHQYEGDGPFTLCLNVYFEGENGSICEATFCVILTVEMLEALGVGSDGFILDVTDISGTLGVNNQLSDAELIIYPNPSNDVVNIKITTLEATKFDLSIIDITGKVLYQESIIMNSGLGMTSLDVSQFSAGMYVVSVNSSYGLINKRFVVSH